MLRSRRRGAGLVFCWAALSVSACDGSNAVTAPGRPSTPAPLVSASVCSAAWQPLTPPQDLFPQAAPWTVPASQLVYQDGTIYYVSSGKDLIAVPTDGSAPTTLASLATSTTELWVDGTNLLFSQGTLNNQIYSLPTTGGTPQLLLDGAAGRTNPGRAWPHAFNATDFYWLEQGPLATVWHQSRSGGVPNPVGTFQLQDYSPDQLGLTANSVLTGGQWLDPRYPASPLETGADAFPFDGRGRIALSIPSSPPTDPAPFVAGVDPLGVYWSIPGTEQHLSALILSPADRGPARELWPSLPFASATFRNVAASPDGGWVVVGNQEFDDGSKRITVNAIDARGTATLLGCAAVDDSVLDLSVLNENAAIAPDAVYFSTQSQAKFTWEIDRIAR